MLIISYWKNSSLNKKETKHSLNIFNVLYDDSERKTKTSESIAHIQMKHPQVRIYKAIGQ